MVSLLEKFPALGQYTEPGVVIAASLADPGETCPTAAIPSFYGEAYTRMLIKADNWIREHCFCLEMLPVGLFDWLKDFDAAAWSEHIAAEAEIDNLIEQRAPVEKFEQALAHWARLYCQLARRAHLALISEINQELQSRTVTDGMG